MLPIERRGPDSWLPKIEEAACRLVQTGLVEVRGHYMRPTKLGRRVSNFSWVPRDSSYVINSIKALNETKNDEELRKQLLFLVCDIGFVRNADKRKVRLFVQAFNEFVERSGRKLAVTPQQMEIQAKMWVLDFWIDGKSLTEITSRLKYVDDADIPQLGHFAAIESCLLGLRLTSSWNLPSQVEYTERNQDYFFSADRYSLLVGRSVHEIVERVLGLKLLMFENLREPHFGRAESDQR